MTTDHMLPDDRPQTESDLDRWDRVNNILGEVFGETEEQYDKWGQQDHPVVSQEDPTGIYLLGRTYRSFEMLAKQRFAAGERSWALIELEEIFEAVSERDMDKARAEWVQVAAVAVSAIAAMDRGAGLPPEGPPMEGPQGRRTTTLALPGDDPAPPGAARPVVSDTAICRLSDLPPGKAVTVDVYAEPPLGRGEVRCTWHHDHPPHDHCYGNGPLRDAPGHSS